MSTESERERPKLGSREAVAIRFCSFPLSHSRPFLRGALSFTPAIASSRSSKRMSLLV